MMDYEYFGKKYQKYVLYFLYFIYPLFFRTFFLEVNFVMSLCILMSFCFGKLSFLECCAYSRTQKYRK